MSWKCYFLTGNHFLYFCGNLGSKVTWRAGIWTNHPHIPSQLQRQCAMRPSLFCTYLYMCSFILQLFNNAVLCKTWGWIARNKGRMFPLALWSAEFLDGNGAGSFLCSTRIRTLSGRMKAECADHWSIAHYHSTSPFLGMLHPIYASVWCDAAQKKGFLLTSVPQF